MAIIDIVLLNFNFLNEKLLNSSSVLPKTLLIIGILIYAINNVAAAFIPPEFEKKSIAKPNRKLNKRNALSNFLTE